MRISRRVVARRLWHLVPEWLRTATRSSRLLEPLKHLFPPNQADQHNELYTASYYRDVDEMSRESAPVMVSSIVRDLHPQTLLDVGCGSGAILLECRRAGIRAKGLEYSDEALKLCRGRGLDVKRFDREHDRIVPPVRPFDVVI